MTRDKITTIKAKGWLQDSSWGQEMTWKPELSEWMSKSDFKIKVEVKKNFLFKSQNDFEVNSKNDPEVNVIEKKRDFSTRVK